MCYLHLNDYVPKGKVEFVEQWPLMKPNDIALLLGTYFLFVLKVGPMIMKTKCPLKIKEFLVLYNLVKVVNSALLASQFFLYITDKGLFPSSCQHDESTIHLIASLYWKYMVTKAFDLLDTVFFVIRKKHDQVSFLHVYHHSFMVLITWSCLKYDPSDHWAFMAVTNCCIHTLMYTYYALSTLGPMCAKYLWWKKYVTLAQMVQFVLVSIHIVIQTNVSVCPMHPASYWISLANLALFLCLFRDFYKKRYQVAKDCKDYVNVGFACIATCDKDK